MVGGWRLVGGWRALAVSGRWRLVEVGWRRLAFQSLRSSSIGPYCRSILSVQAVVPGGHLRRASAAGVLGWRWLTVVGVNKKQFCDCTIHETAKTTPNTQNSRSSSTKTPILCSKRPKTGVPKPKKAQKPRFCARKARKWGFRRAKAHKNLNFVLKTPENGGFGSQKSTKTPILCSGRRGLAVGRENIGIGSATVAFLQITAHASKIQIPHNQIINFYQCAR